MGLIGRLSIFWPPGVVVELIGNDGLAAFIHVYMPHRLFARLVQLRQFGQCCAAPCLRFERQPHEYLHGLGILAHVVGSAPGHFRENAVEGNGLSDKQATGNR